jgi:short-subunit dehydrogenase
MPGNGTYNASKFAVRGFTEALRQELDLTGGRVSATCVHPGGIKTNIAREARFDGSLTGFLMKDEQSGKAKFERGFITTPDAAAATILDAVRKNKRRVLVGPDAHAIDFVQRVLPATYQVLSVRAARRMAQ